MAVVAAVAGPGVFAVPGPGVPSVVVGHTMPVQQADKSIRSLTMLHLVKKKFYQLY